MFELDQFVSDCRAAGRYAAMSRAGSSATRRVHAWRGYGAFSVSSSNIAAVIKYIDNQEAHHPKISFEDEFISLLKKHPFDPKYVFD